MKRAGILKTTFAFLVLLVAGTWALFAVGGWPATFVEHALSRFVRGRLDLDRVSLDPLSGRVEITGLELEPKENEGGGRVLKAPKIVVGVSMNPMASPGRVRTIEVENPELDLELGGPNPFDLGRILDLDELQGAGGKGPLDLPAIKIRGLKVRLHFKGVTEEPLELAPIDLEAAPAAGDPNLYVIEGFCRHPFGGEITIRGTGDPETKSFRIAVEAEPFTFAEGDAARLGSDVADFARIHELSGRVRPRLQLQYPAAGGGLGLVLLADFEDVSFRPPVFRYLFDGLSGRLSWTPDGRRLSVEAKRHGTGMAVDARIRIDALGTESETLQVSVRGRRLLLGERIYDALRGIPEAARILAAFRPRGGRADLDLFVRSGGQPPAGDSRVELDLSLEDLAIEYEGLPPAGPGARRIAFPYPMKHAKARVHLRDGFVRVEDFAADGTAGGRFAGSLELFPRLGTVELAVRAADLPFGDALRKALAAAVEGGDALYDEYAPEGRTDALFSFRIPEAGDAPSFELVLHPKGASATWQGFPYRVGGLGGRVTIRPGDVAFRLRGDRGPEIPIEVSAHFHFAGPKPRRRREIHVVAKNLPLDDRLEHALASFDPELGRRWRLFSPKGRAAVDFLGFGTGGGPFRYDLRADLAGVEVFLEAFPAEVSSLEGPVFVHGDGERSWTDLVGVRGRALGADLLVEGTLREGAPAPGGGDLDTDITIAAKGVVLDDRLAELLADKGIMSRRIWELCRATGKIDAIHRIRRKFGEQEFSQELLLDLRQVESDAKILPDHLHSVSGRVRIDPEHVVHLEEVRGYFGEALVRCHEGTIRREKDRTVLELTLSATEYPVDERLANLLEGTVKKAYLARKPHGRVSVADWHIRLEVPERPPPGVEGLGLRARFGQGEFLAHDLALTFGIELTDIQGRARLLSGSFSPYGADFRGTFNGLSFQALGHLFHDARATFTATHERFTVEKGTARLGRGRVRGPVPERGPEVGPLLDYDFAQGRLSVDLALDDVRIAPLLAGFRTGQRYDGLIQGWIKAKVRTDDLSTLVVDGSVGVAQGRLGDVPIFRTIYSYLRPNRRQNFNAGVVDFSGRDGTLTIQRLMLRSPIFKIEGRGTLDYDGYLKLHVDFPDLFPQAQSYFILPGIYRVLSNMLMGYEIWGYVGDTRTGPRFLFEGRPKRVPLGPLPGRPEPRPPVFR